MHFFLDSHTLPLLRSRALYIEKSPRLFRLYLNHKQLEFKITFFKLSIQLRNVFFLFLKEEVINDCNCEK